MEDSDLVLRSRRVVRADGVSPGDVRVRGSRIVAVVEHGTSAASRAIVDVGELAILPGCVDTHVHVNEPGTDWEGFATATAAAAAGGCTTLVDMPLNSRPVTTDVQALEAKRTAAAGRSKVDYAFWGGLVPGNRAHLPALARSGVLGFKAFLVDSGRVDFPAVGAGDLLRGMAVIAGLDLPLLVHAESPARLAAVRPHTAPVSRSYRHWLESRPSAAEVEAIEQVVVACRETGCRVHIVHVSSAESIPVLRAAREEGLPISAETCPHYLTFSAGEVPEGATAFKCAPPIREAQHREGLWTALDEGILDLVASDHSPCPAALKELESGDFLEAWGGIASLEISLSATWTGATRRGFGLDRLASWMSAAPARLAGIASNKGAIVPGRDADLVIFDPEAEFVVEASKLHHRHPITPYEGMRLRGRVMKTYLRGKPVFEAGVLLDPARGREIDTP